MGKKSIDEVRVGIKSGGVNEPQVQVSPSVCSQEAFQNGGANLLNNVQNRELKLETSGFSGFVKERIGRGE